MPIGVVANASPVGVLPQRLAVRFQRSQAYTVQQNVYVDGSTNVKLISSTSRKVWSMDERMPADELAELRQFFEDHDGATVPFLFYDVSETVPLFESDPTGAAVDGQYVVRFDGAWDQAVNRGRLAGAVTLTIVETA